MSEHIFNYLYVSICNTKFLWFLCQKNFGESADNERFMGELEIRWLDFLIVNWVWACWNTYNFIFMLLSHIVICITDFFDILKFGRSLHNKIPIKQIINAKKRALDLKVCIFNTHNIPCKFAVLHKKLLWQGRFSFNHVIQIKLAPYHFQLLYQPLHIHSSYNLLVLSYLYSPVCF